MKLQVAYSSDNNYAQHVGVSMVSLFENNRDFNDIVVYILENDISWNNKSRLTMIAEQYGREIFFIEMAVLLNKLPLNIGNSIAISAYARLFLASIIPVDVDRILYIDCDSIINESLADLWRIDFNDCYIAGVFDTICPFSENYTNIGLSEADTYINSGVMLIDLNKWRMNNIEQKLIDFIIQRKGKVHHHDQGTINGVLHSRCKIIHPKYNVMSVFFTMSRDQVINYYNMNDYYYSTEEMKEAIMMPVIVHYTPGLVGRPWIKGCKHPLKDLYLQYLKMTPWKDVPLHKDNRNFAERTVMFLYRNLPFEFANKICKTVF